MAGGAGRAVTGRVGAPALEELLARGQAAHSDLVVPPEVFAAHLETCGVPGDCDPSSEDLFVEDLYLVSACLLRLEPAILRLVSSHGAAIDSSLRRIDPSPTFVADARQRVWDSVLVGSIASPPRLVIYSGRGPLGGWLGVAAQRMALMMRRHEDAEGRARRGIVAEAEAVLNDPEVAFLKDRYRDTFRAATERALETLDDRERLIFRLHLVDGVTVERIGKSYGVSHSTISRWFAAAREKVIAEAQRVLREERGIGAADFESLRRLVISQLDLSVSMLPAPRR